MSAPGNNRLRLEWRPFQFRLPRALITAHGALVERRGWLLRLSREDGAVGWGEAAPWPGRARREQSHGPRQVAPTQVSAQPQLAALEAAISRLGPALERRELEAELPVLPACLGFALGLALAELDGLGAPAQGGWRAAPASAWLLPAGQSALAALELVLERAERPHAVAAPGVGMVAGWRRVPPPPGELTVKWKVAAGPDPEERAVLEQLLARLPAGSRLRLDANGGWDRTTAMTWAQRLAAEPRLEWLEQPLAPADPGGLEALAAVVPVALDESLRLDPGLRDRWPGWQVRRSSLEGDPRPLLRALISGTPRLMLSTAFETGIGRRFLAHLAALQQDGPTPTAPGLAPGWRPAGALFGNDPTLVWAAAAQTDDDSRSMTTAVR
ncbi:MAG: o-succinylbenzoate synthase [Cyanobium sp.]